MSTLPATLNANTADELASLLGVGQTAQHTQLPTLRINYQKTKDVDGEKVKLTKGIWTINNGEEDVYGTDLKTRIVMAGYQVREYDATKEEYAAETIFFNTGWDKTPEDSAGGYRCGKVFNRDLEGMEEDEKACQRNKKFYRVLWGIADLKGKNAQGKKSEAKNTPFITRVRGQGFMPICDYIDSFGESHIFDYITEWDIQEGDHETTDFWIPLAKRGKESPALSDKDIVSTIVALKKWRDDYNADILSSWNKRNGLVEAKSVQEVVAQDIVDVDDNLPM